jgi:hypothetical protein
MWIALGERKESKTKNRGDLKIAKKGLRRIQKRLIRLKGDKVVKI